MSITRSHRAVLGPSLAVLALTLLAGCSDSDDDGVAPSTEMPTTPPTGMPTTPPTGMPTGGALSVADLVGDWSTGCLLDDPEDPDSEYESASVSFGDDLSFEFEGDSYSDAGCTASLGEAVELDGTFSLGAGVTTSGGLNATEIDLELMEEDSGEASVSVLDLVFVDAQGSLFFANGDFGELDDLVGQPRPDSLELDEPYTLEP